MQSSRVIGRPAMTDKHIAAEYVIPSDLGEARRIQDEIEEALQSTRYNEQDIFAIKLALEEALVNAIKHGNQMDPDKQVQISYAVTSERFDIRIVDEVSRVTCRSGKNAHALTHVFG